MIGVGENFPNFSMAGVNDENDIIDIDVLLNEWTVVYFYPKDFTFICPTEIADMDYIVGEADVIGISGDNEYCKLAWKEHNPDIRHIRHILAADCGLYLANELGIVDPENGVPFRATYIIDPDGVIQHVSMNALDTGRNANEVLRTLQALKAGGLTGCSWQPGDNFVV
jgi:peroxiredoxin (alkyl hydroperoxide reductase subunit C)